MPLWFSLYVASCSGLSIFDCPFGFLSMLQIALVCPFLIAPFVFFSRLPVALVCPFLLPLWFSLYVCSCSCLSIFDCPFCFLFLLLITFGLRKPKGQLKMDKPEQRAT
jgi:uncharacterized membrane protein